MKTQFQSFCKLYFVSIKVLSIIVLPAGDDTDKRNVHVIIS